MTNARTYVVVAATGLAVTAVTRPATAIEPGEVPQTKSGIFIGSSADVPGPGIYMFDKVFTYQAQLVGLGAPHNNGFPNQTNVGVAANVVGFLINPGWSILGGRYTAVVAQPVIMQQVSPPVNLADGGLHNTFFIPGQISWNFGNGFYAQVGLGIYAPDGTISGPKGINNVGAPYWTFQPQVALSYAKDGWNLTANMYQEFNTKNTVSGYTSGDIFHTDFTATKKFGRWSIGPVAYLTDQVSSDTSSAAYNFVNGGRFSDFAVGGLVAYDFGPATLSLVATDEVYAHTTGGTPGVGNVITPQGWTIFGEVSYKLCCFEEEAPVAPKKPMVYK
jgi:hypothetical protein